MFKAVESEVVSQVPNGLGSNLDYFSIKKNLILKKEQLPNSSSSLQGKATSTTLGRQTRQA